MALPKLDTPTYELEQPSTGEKVKYRPFLVREQKTLMMAQESEDDAQIKEVAETPHKGPKSDPKSIRPEVVDAKVYKLKSAFIKKRG